MTHIVATLESPIAPAINPAEHLMRLATGYVVASALQIAVSLRLADRVARGADTAAALARETGADEDALYRVLRVLAAADVFEEIARRRFALTPSAELLRERAGSLRPIVRWMTDPFHFKVFANLAHAVQTGVPAANDLLGMPLFDYFAEDEAESEAFNDAMTSLSALVAPSVLGAFDFSNIGVIVDVAGGHGHLLSTILDRYPMMQGVLFDVDHVIEGARERLEGLEVAERVDFVAGDVFHSVPAGGDAYLLKHVIHDWDDERAVSILQNVRRALEDRPNGRVLLVESVIQPGNDADLAKYGDIERLALTGGRERTEAEYASLFERAGFRLTRLVPTGTLMSVIEGRPKLRLL